MSARRVLWLSGEVPDAGLGGGSIRQAHLLRALAERAEVHLLLTGSLRDAVLRSSLASVTELGEPPLVPAAGPVARRSRALRLATIERRSQEVLDTAATAARLAAALPTAPGRGDLVQVEHTGLAPLVAQRRAGEAWAITLHTIESVRAAQRAAVARSPRHRWLYSREAARAERNERWVAESYDATWVMSAEDAAAFPGDAAVVPNGVDDRRFVPTPLPQAPSIAFTGTLNYFPNIDACRWFCDEVLPKVRASVPEVKVTLAGRRPPPEVASLATREAVTVLADVPDVLPVLDAARVVVVPVRVGSGTRLKALEAMAAGRPVVGTTIGLEGLGVEDGVHALVADDGSSFADAVVRLLRDDALATGLVRRARALAERFSWERIGAEYVERLLSLEPSS